MIRQQLHESGQVFLMAQMNCYACKPTLAILRHIYIAHLGLDHQLLSGYAEGHAVDGTMWHAGKCTLLYAQHVLAVSLVQLCQGLQASHINCKWQSYLLAVKVPGGCDPQKLLAQNANNCSHGPSAVGLLTLCKPAVQRRSWNISS